MHRYTHFMFTFTTLLIPILLVMTLLPLASTGEEVTYAVTAVGPLPKAMDDLGVATDGADYFLFGGGSADIYKYNPSSDTTEKLSVSLPSALTGPAAIWTGSRAYIFGGGTNKIFKFTPPGTVEELTSTLPLQATNLIPIYDNSRYIYLFNCWQNYWGDETNIMRFDTASEVASFVPATIEPWFENPGVAAAGQYIYIFGGEGRDNSGAPISLKSIYRFEPATSDLVTLTTELPIGLHSTVAVYDGSQYIYLLGGSTGSTAVNTIIRFNTVNETAEMLSTSMPASLSGAAGTWDGRRAHIFGGGTDKIIRFEPGSELFKGFVISFVTERTYLNSGAQEKLAVTVKDKDNNPVANAAVSVTSSSGIICNPISGPTNAQGEFETDLTAPTVTSKQDLGITISVTKTGYQKTDGSHSIAVYPLGQSPTSGGNGNTGTGESEKSFLERTVFGLPMLYFLGIIAVIVVVIIIVIAVLARKKTPEQKALLAARKVKHDNIRFTIEQRFDRGAVVLTAQIQNKTSVILSSAKIMLDIDTKVANPADGKEKALGVVKSSEKKSVELDLVPTGRSTRFEVTGKLTYQLTGLDDIFTKDERLSIELPTQSFTYQEITKEALQKSGIEFSSANIEYANIPMKPKEIYSMVDNVLNQINMYRVEEVRSESKCFGMYYAGDNDQKHYMLLVEVFGEHVSKLLVTVHAETEEKLMGAYAKLVGEVEKRMGVDLEQYYELPTADLEELRAKRKHKARMAQLILEHDAMIKDLERAKLKEQLGHEQRKRDAAAEADLEETQAIFDFQNKQKRDRLVREVRDKFGVKDGMDKYMQFLAMAGQDGKLSAFEEKKLGELRGKYHISDDVNEYVMNGFRK